MINNFYYRQKGYQLKSNLLALLHVQNLSVTQVNIKNMSLE